MQNTLHMRLILKKGEKPPFGKQLRETLIPLCKINNWKLVTLGKRFFEFVFSTIEEMSSILSTGSWTLKFRIFCFLQWVPDFCLGSQKQSNV